MMVVTYATADKSLKTPDDPKDSLHKYHVEIEQLVDVDVVGCAGEGGQIRRVVLSEKTDISGLEDWLGASLQIEK